MPLKKDKKKLIEETEFIFFGPDNPDTNKSTDLIKVTHILDDEEA